MKVFDLKLGEDQDLLIDKGDFVVDESTEQHQFLLLVAEKGEWKQNPMIGVAIRTSLNDESNADDLRVAVQKEFEADGMNIKKLIVNSFEKIDVDAEYADENN